MWRSMMDAFIAHQRSREKRAREYCVTQKEREMCKMIVMVVVDGMFSWCHRWCWSRWCHQKQDGNSPIAKPAASKTQNELDQSVYQIMASNGIKIDRTRAAPSKCLHVRAFLCTEGEELLISKIMEWFLVSQGGKGRESLKTLPRSTIVNVRSQNDPLYVKT